MRTMPLAHFNTRPMTSTSTTSLQLGGEQTLPTSSSTSISSSSLRIADERRKDWIDQSVKYYSTVMRLERRRQIGQAKDWEETSEESRNTYLLLAKKHYFALRKIKDGKHQHAETIYRRIIDELVQEISDSAENNNTNSNGVDADHACDHAPLAVTTLLLALLMQRMGDAKKTRSVFLNFFRIAVLDAGPDEECACSAKVLQAYALFEMKQGNALKSLELVHKAVQLDPSLQPVLQWKQFRDVLQRRSSLRSC
jgi:tetratricopeptide (TPR) repeat protein